MKTILPSGRVVDATLAEELARTATMPGQFARHLENKYGLTKRFHVKGWYVKDDKPVKVTVVEVRGSGCEWIGPAAYALTDAGVLLPTFYLFPFNRHVKPALQNITDEYGTCQQWVAALKPGIMAPWE